MNVKEGGMKATVEGVNGGHQMSNFNEDDMRYLLLLSISQDEVIEDFGSVENAHKVTGNAIGFLDTFQDILKRETESSRAWRA